MLDHVEDLPLHRHEEEHDPVQEEDGPEDGHVEHLGRESEGERKGRCGLNEGGAERWNNMSDAGGSCSSGGDKARRRSSTGGGGALTEKKVIPSPTINDLILCSLREEGHHGHEHLHVSVSRADERSLKCSISLYGTSHARMQTTRADDPQERFAQKTQETGHAQTVKCTLLLMQPDELSQTPAAAPELELWKSSHKRTELSILRSRRAEVKRGSTEVACLMSLLQKASRLPRISLMRTSLARSTGLVSA